MQLSLTFQYGFHSLRVQKYNNFSQKIKMSHYFYTDVVIILEFLLIFFCDGKSVIPKLKSSTITCNFKIRTVPIEKQ